MKVQSCNVGLLEMLTIPPSVLALKMQLIRVGLLLPQLNIPCLELALIVQLVSVGAELSWLDIPAPSLAEFSVKVKLFSFEIGRASCRERV